MGSHRFDHGDLLEQVHTALEELQAAGEGLRDQRDQLVEEKTLVDEDRRRYRELFEGLPDPCIVTDRAGVVREVNRRAARLLHRPYRWVVGKPLALFVQSGLRDGIYDRLSEVRAGGEIRGWVVTLDGEDPAIVVEVDAAMLGERTAIAWVLREREPRPLDVVRMTRFCD